MKKTGILFLILFLRFPPIFSQPVTAIINVLQQPCNGNGIATAIVQGGVPSYTISWRTNGQIIQGDTIFNFKAGVLEMWATDFVGDVGDAIPVRTGLILLDTLYTLPDTCSHKTGVAIASFSAGTPPFNYTWISVPDSIFHFHSQYFSDTITGLSSGYKNIFVIDSAGCVYESASDLIWDMLRIEYFSPVHVSIVTTPANCNGGTATAIVTGAADPIYYKWGNITPIQTTSVVTGLGLQSISVNVIDAAGCLAYTPSTDILPGPDFIITDAEIIDDTCGLNRFGSISLNLSGGTPPYNFMWEDGSIDSVITNISAGIYRCIINDASGCSVIRSFNVLEKSPLYPEVIIDSASCGQADGSIAVTLTGGMLPYFITWDNGLHAWNISAEAGAHYCILNDSNNCFEYSLGNIKADNDSCLGNVRGQIIFDKDSNCFTGNWPLYDPSLRSHVEVTPLQFLNQEENNWFGFFNYKLNPGTYDFKTFIPPNYFPACSSSGNISIDVYSGMDTTIYFFNAVDSMFNDLSILCNLRNKPMVRGTLLMLPVVISNEGTTSASYRAEVQLDPRMSYYFQYSNYDSLVNNTIYFSSTSSPSFRDFHVIHAWLADTANIGDTLLTITRVFSDSPEINLLNNIDTCRNIVADTYEMNEKSVYPEGEGQNGYITSTDSVLTYMIHFKNLTSRNIAFIDIIDTIDSNLETTTFDLLDNFPSFTESFHPLQVDLIDQVLKMSFYTSLHDSIENPLWTEGFTQYRIHLKPNLPAGTVIRNKAWISYNFGEFRPTGEVVNTLRNTVGIEEIEGNSELKIIPNLVTNSFTITTDKPFDSEAELKILNISGRVLYREKFRRKQIVNQTYDKQQLNLAAGVYIVNLKTNQKSYTQKLIVIN